MSDGSSGGSGAGAGAGVASCSPPKSEASALLDPGAVSTVSPLNRVELSAARDGDGSSSPPKSSSWGWGSALRAADGGTLAVEALLVRAGACSTPSKSSSLRAFSLSDACDEPSCAWMQPTFFWKWPSTASSPSFRSPSITISALSRRCHSVPSRRACSSAAMARESSDLTAVTNLRSSSREIEARTPPGAVTSSTRRASYSPAASAGGAVDTGNGGLLAGSGDGTAPQPPPGWPARCGDEVAPGRAAGGGWKPAPSPKPPKLPPLFPPAPVPQNPPPTGAQNPPPTGAPKPLWLPPQLPPP
eukprot:scaffold71715_cov26-Tisochrysis_lutea.AAC.2